MFRGGGALQKSIDGEGRLRFVFYRKLPWAAACLAVDSVNNALFHQIVADPEQLTQLAVQLPGGAVQRQGQQGGIVLNVHGLPDDQITGLCGELPMDLPQIITGAVQT